VVAYVATAAETTTALPPLAMHRVVCPGDPAGNLASFNCNFTPELRLEEFIGNGVTDQAFATGCRRVPRMARRADF
jgi:hypothetical protein